MDCFVFQNQKVTQWLSDEVTYWAVLDSWKIHKRAFLILTTLIPQPRWRDVNDFERSSQNLWFCWLVTQLCDCSLWLLWSVIAVISVIAGDCWSVIAGPGHHLRATWGTSITGNICPNLFVVSPLFQLSLCQPFFANMINIRLENRKSSLKPNKDEYAAWYIWKICPSMNTWKCQFMLVLKMSI